jgi:hypothetical protein
MIFSPIQVISPQKRKRRRSGKSLVGQILSLLFHRLPWMNPRQPLQLLLPLHSHLKAVVARAKVEIKNRDDTIMELDNIILELQTSAEILTMNAPPPG